MNKYIITSPHFAGQVEVTYMEGELSVLDFRQSSIKGSHKKSFKDKIATNEEGLGGCFEKSSVEILKGEVEITIEMFWDKYKKKVNIKRCRPLWDRLSPTQKVKAFIGIDKYFRHLAKTNSLQYKIDPENYLRDERWEDEY